MSIDLLLIDPPLSMRKRYGHFALAGGKEPAIGLCFIAAVARREGFKVKILDMDIAEMDDLSFREYLLTNNPRIVGITATTIAISDAAGVAKTIKDTLPESLTVIGGPHLSCAPDATIFRYTNFDAGVIGEGELTILDLLKTSDLSAKDFSNIKGLVWQEDGKAYFSEHREPIKDLDWLPLPALDLLPDLKTSYIPTYFSVKHTPASGINTSRGCPGRCTFCSNNVHGRKIRYHSMVYILKWIEMLVNDYGMKEVQIMDDTFTANRRRVNELCELLNNANFNLSWSCDSRVNGMTPELLCTMKKAGCWQICFGVESGDEEIIKSINKDIKIETVHKAVNMAKEAGLNVKCFFMMGFPKETRETLQKTRELILSLPIDDLSFTVFTPYPGTPSYKDIQKYGTFNEDWDEMTTLNATFVANGFTYDELIDINRATYRKFYFRPRIVWSYLKRISDLKFFLIIARGVTGLILSSFNKKYKDQ